MEMNDPRVDAVIQNASRVLESFGEPVGPRAIYRFLAVKIECMDNDLIPNDNEVKEALYAGCMRIIAQVPVGSILK